jgi:dynein heavy chain
LKVKLAIQEVELKQKNEAADALIEIVRVETEKVSTEKAVGMMQYGLCFRYDIHV